MPRNTATTMTRMAVKAMLFLWYTTITAVTADLVINEIMRSPTKARDTVGEWFELYNDGATDVDLKDWTVRDNRRNSFKVDASVIVPSRGYAVLGKSATNNGGIPTVSYVYSNSAMDFKICDQLFLVNPNGVRIDSVSWNFNDLPRRRGVSIALASPASDNSVSTSWCLSTAVYGDGDKGTPGAANDCSAIPTPPTPPAPTAPRVAPTPVAPTPVGAPTPVVAPVLPSGQVFIHTIQGSGLEVTNPGAVVTNITAIVTSLFTRNDALDGFFMQHPDNETDGNPLTSEGIFIFCRGKCVPVTAGDRISILSGIVGESQGTSQIDVSGANSSFVILSSNNPLPTPIDLILPAPDSTRLVSTYEQFEGMLVRFPGSLVVSEYFDLARLGQIVLTHQLRTTYFTQTQAPNVAGFAAYRQALLQRTIILDDDTNDSNDATNGVVDEAYFYPKGGLSTTNRFRGGDTITGLTGVLQYVTDGWRIRPVPQVYNYTFVAANATPVQPKAVGGGRLRVASFNVQNYFTTLDTGALTCGPRGGQECRGANSASELNTQRSKLVAALDRMDADIVGLIELENAATDGPLTDLVTALNSVKGGSVYSIIPTGVIGNDTIRVGLIYKSSKVSPRNGFRILDSSVDPLFNSTLNRPSLIQTFTETVGGARFTIAVNHFKSKGENCNDTTDVDLNDGQGNCQRTRRIAAAAVVRFLGTDPTNSTDPDFLMIGSFNAYAQEDAVRNLVTNANYVDLINRFEGSNAYTFLVEGQSGYIDHAMASSSLAAQVTGATEWHINADEIPLFDYNDNIFDAGEQFVERKSFQLNLITLDPLRSSDHDPILIGLNLTP